LAIEAMKSQVQDAKKGQHKRATKDPNQTFVDVDSIRKFQI